MRAEAVSDFLQEKASELRPVGGHQPARLVQIANDLGIHVKLVLRPLERNDSYHARCELLERPLQILVYRSSPTAAIAPVSPANEHLLSSRERFSIAHELGHCIAYQSCGLKPVPERDNRREYWYQERAMNEFASALLVPPWLSSQWKSQLSNFDASCLFRIRDWANACKASPEVVVTALTRDMQGIGFLKVGVGVRLRAARRVLVVFHSSSSSNLAFPNLYSHIDDAEFVNTVTGKGGVIWLPRCRLGSIELKEVQIAWLTAAGKAQSRRREFRKAVRLSGVLYWICAFAGNPVIDKGQGVFRL